MGKLIILTLLFFVVLRFDNALEADRYMTFVDVDSTVYVQSLCLITESTQIKMQCPSSDKLKIIRTIYGFNPAYEFKTSANLDTCTVDATDCHFDKYYSVDNECTGKNTCIITITKSKVMNESQVVGQACTSYNYLQINYQCLPNLPTKDICANSRSELSHAYIVTPNFPSKLSAGANCECTLSTNYENGQILLRRLDMKLPNDHENQKCGGTYLEINENNKSTERKCGYVREAGSIFGSGSKKLKLKFYTGENDNFYDSGFWLEVLASPPKENHVIQIVCNNGLKPPEEIFSGIENVQVIKKLEEIHEKLRRINKTLTYQNKSGKLSNKTQEFLEKNNKKFFNMTNNFGLIKKVNSKSSEEAGKKNKTEANSHEDLETEIDKFFKSKDDLLKKLEKFDDKKKDKKIQNPLIDILSLIKNKPLFVKQKSEKNLIKNKKKLESEEEELEKSTESNSAEEFVKELETLEKELDIGEKILTKKEPLSKFNHANISETLTGLINERPNKVSRLTKNRQAPSTLNVVAQRQDVNSPRQNSSSKELASLNVTERNHVFIKRVLPLFRTSRGTDSTEIPSQTPEHQAPPEWLHPFKFKYEDSKELGKLSTKKMIKISKISRKLSTTTNLAKVSFNRLLHANSDNETLASNDTLQMRTSMKNCDKNLTKLSVFYSNADKLNCFETQFNRSLLKCIDDLLETKLMRKIGLVYYVQLQPLFISKTKMNCFDAQDMPINWDLGLPKSVDEEEEYETNATSYLNSLQKEEIATAESHGFLSDFELLKNSFSCSFVTKKVTNRKKLIWKLYLIPKNQTCLQMNDLKSLSKINELKNHDLGNFASRTSRQPFTSHDILSNTYDLERYTDEPILHVTPFVKTMKATRQNSFAFFQLPDFLSNKIILLILIASSFGFILLANGILYIILKTKKSSSSNSNNNNFSMSMNNRLLQNYLDLSVHSENSTKNQKDLEKRKSKLKSPSAGNSDTATIIDSCSDVRTSDDQEYQFNEQIEANFARKNKMDNIANLSENFTSVSGLVNGMDSRMNMNQSNHQPILDINYQHAPKATMDDLLNTSLMEINRIPSVKKPIYSVSTIATQADMDKGTISAERKDYKYRNQDMSDVESQILSIELDCYASVGDWGACKANQIQNSRSSASVTVNDYVAFKNCLNFQLQAAKAMANKIENKIESPIVHEFKADSKNHPIKNRMVVRISSKGSSIRSVQKTDSLEDSKESPLISLSQSEDDAFKFSPASSSSFLEPTKHLPKLIYEAYQSALNASYSNAANTDEFLKSFQNNLYMNLDSIPNFKSIQGSLINSKDFIENFLKVNLVKSGDKENALKQSSTLNTILDGNESCSSGKLDESFMRCYHINSGQKSHKDPNMVYSNVESDGDSFGSSYMSTNSNIPDKKPRKEESSCNTIENFGLTKAEKFKKMLDHEKELLELHRKKISNQDQSEIKKLENIRDEEYSTDEYNYVNNHRILNDDECASSNESKNVRFADNVSYI